MTNNRVSSISKIYAKALMDIATENNSYDSMGYNFVDESDRISNIYSDITGFIVHEIYYG